MSRIPRSIARAHRGKVTTLVTPSDAPRHAESRLAGYCYAYRHSVGAYFAGAVPAEPSGKTLPAARHRHLIVPSGVEPATSASGAASLPVYGIITRLPPPAAGLNWTVMTPLVESTVTPSKFTVASGGG